MADIKQIRVDNTTLNFKDEVARNGLDALAEEVEGKQDAINAISVDYVEDNGSPDASVDFQDGELAFTMKNMKMKFSELTSEEKATLKGDKGDQGDSVLVGQGDLPLAHVLGQDNAKAMSQKGVTDALYDNLFDVINLDTNEYESIPFVISPPDTKWYDAQTYNHYSKVIPIPDGILKIKLSPTSSIMMWSLLSNYTPPQNASDVETIADGLDARYSSETDSEITEFSNAKYLVVRADVDPNGAECPEIKFFLKDVKTRLGTLESEVDNILSSPSGRINMPVVMATSNIYADHTDGVVKTQPNNANFRGFLYEVKNGDVVDIVGTTSALGHRYAFFPCYPAVSMTASSYGVANDDKGLVRVVSTCDGFLWITLNHSGDYPLVIPYKANDSKSVPILDNIKEDQRFEFNRKLDFCVEDLTALTSASIIDGVLTVSDEGEAESEYMMVDDEVKITAIIKPTSSAFNILWGRNNNSNGTLFGLRKDTGSYIDIYKTTTLTCTVELPFTLAANVDYYVEITKYTLNNTWIDFSITSNDGHHFHLHNAAPEQQGVNVLGADTSYTIGKLWGTIYAKSVNGGFALKNLNIYTPYKKDCKVALVGHSFVEGNSIEGYKMHKFGKLLQKAIGVNECGIFGIGGAWSQPVLELLQGYIATHYTPSYVMVCVGTNDTGWTLPSFKTWMQKVVTVCERIGSIPVFFTIPPSEGTYRAGWAQINSYIRESDYMYIDMDKAMSANGTNIANNYIFDGIHPNPNTHHGIYNTIISTIPELLVKSIKEKEEYKAVSSMAEVIPEYEVEGVEAVVLSGVQEAASIVNAERKWSGVTTPRHKVIDVVTGDKFIVKGDGKGFIWWMDSNYNPSSIAFNTPAPLVDGYSRELIDGAVAITAPDGAAYLGFTYVNGSGVQSDIKIWKVSDYKRRKGYTVRFRYATWNIGMFVYTDWTVGAPTHAIPAEDAEEYAQKYHSLVNSIGADVMGCCEFDPSYSAANWVAKDTIFNCFNEIVIPKKVGVNCNPLMSNIFKVIGYEEVDYTASQYNRYFAHYTVRMAGEIVHIVQTHLDHTYNEMRVAEIGQVIAAMAGYKYVIIAGDFNTGDEETIDEEMSAFTNAGYQIANCGYIGHVITSLTQEYVDHICAKGFAITNVNAVEESGTLSDHLLLYADLTMILKD